MLQKLWSFEERVGANTFDRDNRIWTVAFGSSQGSFKGSEIHNFGTNARIEPTRRGIDGRIFFRRQPAAVDRTNL